MWPHSSPHSVAQSCGSGSLHDHVRLQAPSCPTGLAEEAIVCSVLPESLRQTGSADINDLLNTRTSMG